MTSIASNTNEAGTAQPRGLVSQKRAREGPDEESIEAMATPDPSTTSRTESEVEEEGGMKVVSALRSVSIGRSIRVAASEGALNGEGCAVRTERPSSTKPPLHTSDPAKIKANRLDLAVISAPAATTVANVENLEDPPPLETRTQYNYHYEDDYYKEKPSKARCCILLLLGLALTIGGGVWALWHFNHATSYSEVETGQPVSAVLCSKEGAVGEECRYLSLEAKHCTLAIEYTFVVPSSERSDQANATQPILGNDILQFVDPPCHDLVQSSIDSFLGSANLTIHYDAKDPTDNHYHEPHDASTMAAIIAGVSFAVGVLLICTSVLECFL